MILNNLWSDIETAIDMLDNPHTGSVNTADLVPVDTFVVGGTELGSSLSLKQAQTRIKAAKEHGAIYAFSQDGGEFGKFVSLYRRAV